MNKASDYFREMCGERVLRTNPAALAVYKTLAGWEEHHAAEHKDCEDAAYERLRAAMEAVYDKPLALAAKQEER